MGGCGWVYVCVCVCVCVCLGEGEGPLSLSDFCPSHTHAHTFLLETLELNNFYSFFRCSDTVYMCKRGAEESRRDEEKKRNRSGRGIEAGEE